MESSMSKREWAIIIAVFITLLVLALLVDAGYT